MIRAVFGKDWFVVEGHANFDEYGKDVVCAAVSSIVQHSMYIFQALGARVSKEKGKVEVRDVPKGECSEIVMKVTLSALRDIERKYPESIEVEVV